MSNLWYLFHYLEVLCNSNRKLFDAIKWSGNIWFYTGAVLVSASAYLSSQSWVFVTFLLGHITWLFAGYVMRDRPLFFQNLVFIPIDSWAVLVRL